MSRISSVATGLLLAASACGTPEERNAVPAAPTPPTVVAAPIEDERKGVGEEAKKATEESTPKLDAAVQSGTNAELEDAVKNLRAEAKSDQEELNGYEDQMPLDIESQEEKNLIKKIDQLKVLHSELALGKNADFHLSFTHKGTQGFYGYSEGEGVYMNIQRGDELLYIDMTGGVDTMQFDLRKTANPNESQKLSEKDKRVAEFVDFASAALTEELKKAPSYRLIDGSNTDVHQNGGLNLRNNNGHTWTTLNENTYVQVLGNAGEDGRVYVYSLRDDDVLTGWVAEQYLGEPVQAFDLAKTEIKELPSIKLKVTGNAASNGGLNLREGGYSASKLLGKIPVGTEVTMLEKRVNPTSVWVRIEYTEGSEVKEGWACMVMDRVKYLEELN